MISEGSRRERARGTLLMVGLVSFLTVSSRAGGDPKVTALPALETTATKVAGRSPAGTFKTIVSDVQLDPTVDVQSRNLAEGQADIVIRGGIFENSGLRLGPVGLSDPQTGHYLVELPVPPQMLGGMRILTGSDNARASANATAGSLSADWKEIESRGEISFGAGPNGLGRQDVYLGIRSRATTAKPSLGADVAIAHSESDGPVQGGDHRFDRIAGRIQITGRHGRTDLFAGYQAKFLGWPNLYTPFNSNESDNLQTGLLLLNHRLAPSEKGHGEFAMFYRRNKGDYVFDRRLPVNATHPFQHTTWTRGMAGEGRRTFGNRALGLAGQVTADQLRSTSLNFGRFNSRTSARLAAIVEQFLPQPSGEVMVRGGVVYEASNRASSHWAPLLRAEWRPRTTGEGDASFYVDCAESTAVPSYTALNSNPAAGLFRGNATLGREISRNWEGGVLLRRASWRVRAALFHRQDLGLVDWTYRRGVTARTANAVDTATSGAEFVATGTIAGADLTIGYTALRKRADYGPVAVDASFYALNFARHRLTAAIGMRLGHGCEVRVENEFRVQESNPLRTTGGDEALATSAGFFFRPESVRGLELSLSIDNLWNSRFQSVPAVPATPRLVAGGATWRW